LPIDFVFCPRWGSPVTCVKAFLTHLLGVSVRIDAVGEVQLIVRLLREDSQNFPRQGLRRDAAHVSLSLSVCFRSPKGSPSLLRAPKFSLLLFVQARSASAWDLRDPLCWGAHEGNSPSFSWFLGGMRERGEWLQEPRHEGSKRVLWWWAPFANTVAELPKMGRHGVYESFVDRIRILNLFI